VFVVDLHAYRRGHTHDGEVCHAINGGPVPVEELVGIVAAMWGIDNPPAAELPRANLSVHLAYADIVACSEGHGNPQQLGHIHRCATCQAEVQDLSRFRTELVGTPRRPIASPRKSWVRYRMPLAIAAAVLAIAGGASVALRRPKPETQAPTFTSTTQPDPTIPAAEREILQRAMTSGQLERAPVLDHLITRRGALPNPNAPKPAIELLAPVGTTVLSDRPILRWTPVANATSYVVAILDAQSRTVAESPALTSTDWQPSAPLPRAKLLKWQVTIRTAARTVKAPAPPEPEARFQIVEREVAPRIEAMRRQFPGNPLLLAALYAHAGALDDAESLLKSMDPGASQSYRESLRRIRVPE